MIKNLETEGILYYESELVAMFNVINSCRNVINTKSSIKEDVRSINQILREDPLYHTDNTKRRQVIALKVAIANKQTV